MRKNTVKKLGLGILLIVIVLLFVWNGRIRHDSEFINVKYRQEEVDTKDSRWEYLDTAGSSFIEGAWYDEVEEYMIINLSGTNYHYCGLPVPVWEKFKEASSFGSDYNRYIRGNYDCREGGIPSY
jgi:hypothetical protein